MLKQEDVSLEEKREYLVRDNNRKVIGRIEEVTPTIFKCFALEKGQGLHQLYDATTKYQAVEEILSWHNNLEKTS